MNRMFRSGSIAVACLFAVASLPTVRAQTAPPTTAPSDTANHFDHLPHRDGGPPWSIDDLAAEVPASVIPMEVDGKKNIPPITDPMAAMKTAILRLTSHDPADYDLAYRLAGATANKSKLPTAYKLLAFLQHHGIGTHADAGGCVRTAMQLVRLGEQSACEFVAHADPKQFAANARQVSSSKKLADLSQPTVVKINGTIKSSNDVQLNLQDDAPFVVSLKTAIDKLKPGRVVSVAGLCVGGKLTALMGEVPEPSVEYNWQLMRKSVRRDYWQLQTVNVTFHNKGIQPVKSLKFHVRCAVADVDHTRDMVCPDLAPGQSRTIAVSFDNYWYYENVSTPRAEVGIDDTEW